MIFKTVLKKQEKSRLILCFSSNGRILFAVVAIFLLAGMLQIQQFPVVLVILCGISFFAAAYNEKWVFDKTNKEIQKQSSLFYIYKRQTFSSEQLKRVILRVVSGPGKMEEYDPMNKNQAHIPKILQKGRAVLLLEFSLHNKQDQFQRFVIDDTSHRDAERLEGLGYTISQFHQCEFTKGANLED